MTARPIGEESFLSSYLQYRKSTNDSLVSSDTLKAVKALGGAIDSLVRDSMSLLLLSKKTTQSKDTLLNDTAKVSELKQAMQFSSNDSIVLRPNRNSVHLYGNSEVTYGVQKVSGDYMSVKTDSGTLFATYIDYPDSLEREKIYAKIKNENEEFEAKSLSFNLKTQRGYITDVVTRQGEGYITAQRTKRMENQELYMEDGIYTTCDRIEDPHFYIKLTRAKVRPEKNLVAGPVYLVMADVPLPIGLPFGFFPFTKSRASGIIVPTYGDEMDRGFYLRNGGYYFAINDYLDAELTGDIYTKGSWALNATTNYRKRYRYSGNINASYIVTKRGDQVAGDLSKGTDFRIAWSHQQDPKANPYRTFSANVNYSTSRYNHNNLDNLYNPQIMGQNTKSSSISFSQRFPNSPWSITGSMDINQRSQDSTVSVTLPNLSISMSRIYPFKRKKQVGKERWYEKISLSYSGQIRNSVQTKERLLFTPSTIKKMKNGVNHSIPVSASFDLFNYIKVSPSISYTERWYTNRIKRAYDPDLNRVVPVDTTYNFYRLWDFNTSLSLSTTVYGFWKPLSWVPWFGKNISMIRHRMEPSVSISYRPDFGMPRFGYWEELDYIAIDGRRVKERYSPYEQNPFGVPSGGKSGSINFSLGNNVEAKVRNKADSTEFKKVSLIESFQLGTSYNMAADSFQWGDLSASLSLRFTKDFTLRLGGSFDLYTYDYHIHDGQIMPYRVDKLRILSGKGIGRYRGTSTSFSYNLNPESLKRILTLVGLNKRDKNKEEQGSPDSNSSRDASFDGNKNDSKSDSSGGGSFFGHSHKEDWEYDPYGYSINKVNWNVGFNYNLSLGWGAFDTRIREYKYQLRHDLSFNGNLSITKNWNFNFSANYNFELNRITNMTCNISRDLHCWSMTASFIPIGPYKSYNFTVAVKSQLLQDLKWFKNSQPSLTGASLWYD